MKAEIVRWKDVQPGDRFLHPGTVQGIVQVKRIERSGRSLTVFFIANRRERHMQVDQERLVAIVAR